jgi:alpha-glucosidase (family GH31 glycosyl hydrolase)
MKISNRNQIKGTNYRFTVLTPYLIRLEYSHTGNFVNEPTQVVVNREFPEFEFDYLQNDERVEIITEALRLYYFPKIDSSGFTVQNLFIDLRSDLSAYHGRWRFGERAETLKGTAHTLDMADGAVELDEGIISRNGYAVLDDSDSFVLIDGAHYMPREPESADWYFFGYLHNYRQALLDFYRLTGPPPLLPRFALGNWWSRFWPYTAQEYLELMNQFQEHQVPLSVCMLDMDWHLRDIDSRFGSSWTGYTWNRELIPDPKLFLQQLHQRGLKVGLNVHPADGIRAYEEVYPKVSASLNLVSDLEEPALFDLNNSKFVRAYFDLVHRPLEKQGVDFWWVDWQQGNHVTNSGLSPRWNLNYLHYQHAERSTDEPLILSRYAGPGSHRFPVGFSGDTIISWKSLAFQPYFTATASNIGFGWWSHDIGGHMEGYHDPELLLRWLQFGVFSPINRMHSSSNPFNSKAPWGFCEPYQSSMIHALQLRHQLIPYLYTMNVNHHNFGLPLILPMYYHQPDCESAYEVPNQYLFGSELMVAPLITKLDEQIQLTGTEVWFPEGVWFDFFKGHRYHGETKLRVFRTLAEIPVFAKAGAIVPLDADLTGNSTSELPETLNWKVFGGADNQFVLVETGKCACANTTVTLDRESQTVRLEVEDAQHILPSQRQHYFTYIDGNQFYDFSLSLDRPVQQLKNIAAASSTQIAHRSVDLSKEWFDRLQSFQIDYEQKRRLLDVWEREDYSQAINSLRAHASESVFDALLELLFIRQCLKEGKHGQNKSARHRQALSESGALDR